MCILLLLSKKAVNGYCKGGTMTQYLEVVKPATVKVAYERLEPCVRKLTSTVLMGLGFSNEPRLPNHRRSSRWKGRTINGRNFCYDCKVRGSGQTLQEFQFLITISY